MAAQKNSYLQKSFTEPTQREVTEANKNGIQENRKSYVAYGGGTTTTTKNEPLQTRRLSTNRVGGM